MKNLSTIKYTKNVLNFVKLPIILAALSLLLLIPLASQDSFAQINDGGFQAGGVNIDGSWYVGEGLKVGDYFSFNVCHVDYLDCSDFDLSLIHI